MTSKTTEHVLAGQGGGHGVISPSRLVRVCWLNMDRRPDRAAAHRAELVRAGLDKYAERISAVNGREMDLRKISEDILTAAGREQALNPPKFVLGRVLTPGAVGLWLTWHKVLARIAKEAKGPDECYLIAEDDAEYGDKFQERIADVFKALDTFDESWHAVAVGFIRSKTKIKPLLGHGPDEGNEGTLDNVIGRIGKLCGAAAVAVRGREGARALLEALFPINMDNQLDYKLSCVVDYFGVSLRMYCSAAPLAAAPLSEAGDSDIQQIPAEKQARFKLEARIRHELGDAANSESKAVEQLVQSGRLDAIVSEPGMPRLEASELEGLVVEVYKSLEQMRRPQGTPVRWSLKETLYLAGSWSDWHEPFTEMRRVPGRGPAVHRAEIPNVRGGATEEFQILVAGEWGRRFFPMERRPGANILGPFNKHGYNFARRVPAGCTCMVVTFDPVGMRSLDVSFTARPGQTK